MTHSAVMAVSAMTYLAAPVLMEHLLVKAYSMHQLQLVQLVQAATLTAATQLQAAQAASVWAALAAV